MKFKSLLLGLALALTASCVTAQPPQPQNYLRLRNITSPDGEPIFATGVVGVYVYNGVLMTRTGTGDSHAVGVDAIPAMELDDLTDVVTGSPTNKQLLGFQSSDNTWRPFDAKLGTGFVKDVTITSPATNQILKWNGTAWVNAAAPTGVTTLANLTDVDFEGNSPATGNILRWNNGIGAWTLSTDNTDDTVQWSEISAIIGTTSTTVAVGNHTHTNIVSGTASATMSTSAITVDDTANENASIVLRAGGGGNSSTVFYNGGTETTSITNPGGSLTFVQGKLGIGNTPAFKMDGGSGSTASTRFGAFYTDSDPVFASHSSIYGGTLLTAAAAGLGDIGFLPGAHIVSGISDLITVDDHVLVNGDDESDFSLLLGKVPDAEGGESLLVWDATSKKVRKTTAEEISGVTFGAPSVAVNGTSDGGSGTVAMRNNARLAFANPFTTSGSVPQVFNNDVQGTNLKATGNVSAVNLLLDTNADATFATLTETLINLLAGNKAVNTVLAGPASGGSGALVQRALVAEDIPSTQATDAEVAAAVANTVTAASPFGADDRLIMSDGTGRGAGVTSLSVTGAGTGLTGSGTGQFGNVVSGGDVITGGAFQSTETTGTAFSINDDTDFDVFDITDGGTLQWGADGSAAPDTNLYRREAGILTTDGALEVTLGLQASSLTLDLGVDSEQGFGIFDSNDFAAWTIGFGPESEATPMDTFIYRSGSGEITVDEALKTSEFTATGSIISGGSISAASQVAGSTLASTASTGTPPLDITSTTKVTNLNVDKIDGLDSTDFVAASSAALSVKGRSANSTGAAADIAAASDHQVLRRSGSAIGFGAINLASADAVTGDLPDANLTANVPLLSATNAFTGINVFGNEKFELRDGHDALIFESTGRADNPDLIVDIGDVDSEGNGTKLTIDDGSEMITASKNFQVGAGITAAALPGGTFTNVIARNGSGELVIADADGLGSYMAAEYGNPVADDTYNINDFPQITTRNGIIVEFASCFPGDVTVTTPAGERRIDSLLPGEMVSSLDPFGRVIEARIEKVDVHEGKTDFLQIAFSEGNVTCTPDHPIWSDETGFEKAFDLRVGYTLRRMNGDVAPISSITPFRDTATTVYNLKLAKESTHVYFANGILVHNK